MELEKKASIYFAIINRYKSLINEKETQSVSIIRQRVSPYNDYIRQKRDIIISNFTDYQYGSDFVKAAQIAIDHIRGVETIEFSFNFYLEFSEIDSLGAATSFDKAIYLVALLRSLGSSDAKILVTKSRKQYVKFFAKSNFVFSTESGSLFSGKDIDTIFENDPVSYSFNDQEYENFDI